MPERKIARSHLLAAAPEVKLDRRATRISVFSSADGAFSLYEDDGLTYGYERGQSTRIPLRWDNKTKTLNIEKREGSFPGMLAERTFNVVLISPDKGVGFSFEPKPDQTVRYSGKAVKVSLAK